MAAIFIFYLLSWLQACVYEQLNKFQVSVYCCKVKGILIPKIFLTNIVSIINQIFYFFQVSLIGSKMEFIFWNRFQDCSRLLKQDWLNYLFTK